MPVSYEDGDARVKLGKGSAAADKLANEIKKVGQALKQRGIETALTSPKLAQEFESYTPNLHVPKLQLKLHGRHSNGTKRVIPPPEPEPEEPPPANLMEKLERDLLSAELLEEVAAQHGAYPRAPLPRPWFGPASLTPEPGAASPHDPSGRLNDEGHCDGSEEEWTLTGMQPMHRKPHLALVFPLHLPSSRQCLDQPDGPPDAAMMQAETLKLQTSPNAPQRKHVQIAT